mmetsp:Transcript_6752/g.16194  ORF Transcript_6752/g.16194 Transcript_6752/m.16194 type:complete len:313 (-) Transcript_6752:246-1184(-)
MRMKRGEGAHLAGGVGRGSLRGWPRRGVSAMKRPGIGREHVCLGCRQLALPMIAMVKRPMHQSSSRAPPPLTLPSSVVQVWNQQARGQTRVCQTKHAAGAKPAATLCGTVSRRGHIALRWGMPVRGRVRPRRLMLVRPCLRAPLKPTLQTRACGTLQRGRPAVGRTRQQRRSWRRQQRQRLAPSLHAACLVVLEKPWIKRRRSSEGLRWAGMRSKRWWRFPGMAAHRKRWLRAWRHWRPVRSWLSASATAWQQQTRTTQLRCRAHGARSRSCGHSCRRTQARVLQHLGQQQQQQEWHRLQDRHMQHQRWLFS